MRILPIVLVILFCVSSLPAQDWPQWRGPNRDGVAHGIDLPAEWPSRLNRSWSVKVGTGHASPVVVGDTIYQFARRGENEAISAISLASGKILWTHDYPAPYTMSNAALDHGKGPKSTPVVHGGRVCTLGISGILTCVDQESGQRIWQKEFSKRFNRTSPIYGTAMSPIVYKDTLIAHVGGHGGGALIAFDLATGAEKWAWDADGPGYTSPIIVEVGGKPVLVTQSQDNNIAVAPDTGALLWKAPFKTPYTQNIVTPILHGGILILSGLQNPTEALRLKMTAGKLTPEKLWEDQDAYMYMNSPVLLNGSIVGFTKRNSGQYFCQNPTSGEITWRGKPRSGDNAAIVRSGETLLMLTDEADLTIARLDGGQLTTLKTYSVADSPTWAHPVPVKDGILIKDLTALSLLTW